MKGRLELPLDFLDSISLDNVTDLDIVISLDIETAVKTCSNLLDIILESLERSELACINHDTVTDHAHLRSSLKLTLTDNTSGNCSHLRDLECLLNLSSSSDNLLLLWLKHTLDTALELIDTVIDDRVETDFDLLLLSQLAG